MRTVWSNHNGYFSAMHYCVISRFHTLFRLKSALFAQRGSIVALIYLVSTKKFFDKFSWEIIYCHRPQNLRQLLGFHFTPKVRQTHYFSKNVSLNSIIIFFFRENKNLQSYLWLAAAKIWINCSSSSSR